MTSKTDPNYLQAARQEYRLLRQMTLLALILCCAIPLSLNLVDPDLWGHVLYGQELLADAKLPTTATHTFTASSHRWVNHENLAEITLAVGFETIGLYGMLVAKCLWGLAILGLMVLTARRHQVDQLVAWAVMLLIANNLIAFFPMRPQLLSFMCFALMLVVLDRAFFRWHEKAVDSAWPEWKWLCLLPVIVVLWTNSHGAFVAGVCILEFYLGGRCLELLWKHGTIAWPKVLTISVVGAVSSTATLLNPYGWELLSWLFNSLGQPRPEITEWAPASMHDPVFWPFVCLVVVMCGALLGSKRRRDWVQIAILALVTWQAISHLRHIALLALLVGFWLPGHIQSALIRLRPKNKENLPVVRINPWFLRTVVLGLAITIGLLGSSLQAKLSDFPVARNRHPVDVLQFMANQNLKGRLVVSFNWAQYAIAALVPDIQVAFDGRFRTCYPQEIVDMHFDFLLGEHGGKRYRSPKSGPINGARVLEYGEPNLVLIDRTYSEPVKVMHQQAMTEDPRWTLLYQDGTAQLWGLGCRYNDPKSPEYLPQEKRILTDTLFTSSRPWPALPEAAGSNCEFVGAEKDLTGKEM